MSDPASEPKRRAPLFLLLATILVVGLALGLVRGGEEPSAPEAPAQASAIPSGDDPTSAAVARVIRSVVEASAPAGARFEAAVDTLADERFLDVARLVREDDFAWHHAAIDAYAAAAEGSLASLHDLARLTSEACAREGLPPTVTQSVVQGARGSAARNRAMFERHRAAAAAYRALLESIEAHRAAYVAKDGSFSIEDEAARTEFTELSTAIDAAEAAVQEAIATARGRPGG